MAGLGTGDSITYSQTQACTKFVSKMYGKESTSLTTLRCERAGDIRKHMHVTAKKLPPTDNVFCLHLQRVSYQLKVWRQACQAIQVLPSPFNYGYQRQTDGSIKAQHIDQPCDTSISCKNLLTHAIHLYDDRVDNWEKKSYWQWPQHKSWQNIGNVSSLWCVGVDSCPTKTTRFARWVAQQPLPGIKKLRLYSLMNRELQTFGVNHIFIKICQWGGIISLLGLLTHCNLCVGYLAQHPTQSFQTLWVQAI